MIIVTIIICSILSYWISIWAIVPIGFIILTAWLLLNIRAGTSGLIDTVAYGYYFYRSKELSHEEAIAKETVDRYRFLGAGRDTNLALLLDERLDSTQPEFEQVKEFIFLLFCVEHGFDPTTDVRDRIWDNIEMACNKYAARTGIHVD